MPKRSRFFLIRTLTLLNLIGLALLYLLETFVAERSWFTTLLAYAPQVFFCLPTVLVTLTTLLTRQRDMWALLFNSVAVLFCLFPLLGLHVAMPPLQTPVSAAALRIMTYNVAHGSGGFEKVAAVVRQIGPDVLCLQEANEVTNRPDIRALFPEYRYWALHGQTPIASRFPIESSRSHRFPLAPEGQDGTEAILICQRHRLTILNIHLLPYRYYPLQDPLNIPRDLRVSTARRAAQFPALRTLTESLQDPLVLCGDFNTPPRGLFYGSLLSGNHPFRDAFAEAGTGFGWTLTGQTPATQVDHILLRGATLRTPRVFVPVARKASDHRPMVADLYIR